MTDERWQLAHAIYESAAPLSEPLRQQYVQANAPDAEIASRVLSMLDEIERATASDVFSEGVFSTGDAARPSLAPGTRLGPYEIHSRIGAGGMGVVYRALDPRLNRHVAIKLLLPELPLTFRPRSACAAKQEQLQPWTIRTFARSSKSVKTATLCSW